MVGRRFGSSGDLGDASSYLIDADGSDGASQPWRILRASSSHGLGIGNAWFWDPLNPLHIINVLGNGTIQEVWPIGGTGHSVGEINTFFQVSGVDNAGSAHTTGLKTSYDVRYYMMPCRHTSDGALGGHRIDLIAGTAGPFIKTPLQSKNDTSRAAMGISPLGNDTFSNANLGGSYNRYQIKNVVTDTVTAIVPDSNSFSHVDFAIVDGV